MEHPWKPFPPNVAYATRKAHGFPLEFVTWDQIMGARREKQSRRLRDKRFNNQGTWRPVFLDCRYYDIQFYGGWQCYIYGVGGIAHWVRGRSGDSRLMELFPLREGLFPVEDWYNWKRVFAETYPSGKFHKRSRGRQVIWARVSDSGQWASFHEYALKQPGS